MFYFTDPKNGKKSVSLTLMMLSFLLMVIGSVLVTFGKMEDLTAFTTLFLTCSGLYFGRRNINLNKQSGESE
jgi:hypothetical protein